MKANLTRQLAAGMLAFALCAPTVHAQNAPKMKMTTPVPPGISTPDSVETRLGTLRFTDGFPDDATINKVLDNLDSSGACKPFWPPFRLHRCMPCVKEFVPSALTTHLRSSLNS